MAEENDVATAQGQLAGFSARVRHLAADQWDRLTAEDLEEVADDRGRLARMIAGRYELSIREAKRQVRDLLRAARAAEGGGASGGKRMRRAVERATGGLAESLADVRDRIRLLRASLPGISGTRDTKPSPGEEALGWDSDEAAGAEHEVSDAAPSGLPGESGTGDVRPQEDEDESPSRTA